MPRGAPLFHVAFQLPRRGHSPDECQDAWAAAPRRGRFAVADGATESIDAGLWARLLVRTYTETDRLPDWPGWLALAQTRWIEQTAPDESGAMPWFLEERHRQGAFSTFLGLSVADGRWQAVAIGDTCLFHVRGGRLLETFPLERAAQFDNTPWLIGARTEPENVPHAHRAILEGEALPGDQFWLATDALAQCLLGDVEAGSPPWDELMALADCGQELFASWAGRRRAARELRNDDTTLLGVLP